MNGKNWIMARYTDITYTKIANFYPQSKIINLIQAGLSKALNSPLTYFMIGMVLTRLTWYEVIWP